MSLHRSPHERPHHTPHRPALPSHAAVSARARQDAVPQARGRRRQGREGDGQGHADGRARGAARAGRGRLHRHQSSAAAGALEAAAQDPRRPGGQRQRQVRRLRFPQERQYRGRRRAADVPGHRHRHHHGQEGPHGVHRRFRRGRFGRGRARRLSQTQFALFAAGADLHVRGEEHQEQHAGAGRDLCRGRGRLQAAVHRQRRRLGQQVVSVPGDAVDPDARPHAGLPQGEGAHARHRRVPALPSGDRDRRHLGRADHEDGEARLDALSRRRCRPRAARTATPSAISTWSRKC